jgi:hypothetical protein
MKANAERRAQNAERRKTLFLNSSFCALRSAFLLLIIACSRDTLSPSEWQRMSRNDKVLYINSLKGAEQVKEAKGGDGRVYERPAEEYVARIDAAYARGEQREVHHIFAEMGTR